MRISGTYANIDQTTLHVNSRETPDRKRPLLEEVMAIFPFVG